ncbi:MULTISPECIES: hypothetical protein [unclassified Pseudoclavibacter]|uniref:hypothetical protein n=1 Tax=unclassified Pseudoclavibacter TaxID=2615177 RepID=UPI001BACA1E2|nr:hypothetical protein [Pseudoclavibacter sp. Marseille-Q4354]MBS3180009.1 hypothetical protein [Pseudoclavibacter sp. Marseille-Q4354]
MAKFKEWPKEAVQFTGRESIEAVSDLVRKYRGPLNFSYSDATETLRFDGHGHELLLKLSDWIAVVNSTAAVIPADMMPDPSPTD